MQIKYKLEKRFSVAFEKVLKGNRKSKDVYVAHMVKESMNEFFDLRAEFEDESFHIDLMVLRCMMNSMFKNQKEKSLCDNYFKAIQLEYKYAKEKYDSGIYSESNKIWFKDNLVKYF